MEKAHPDVWNVLLQVLDDGRLTDGQGRTVDFRNAVVIMTSNIGSEFLRDPTDRAAADTAVQEALRRAFRPEFLNRIDEIITFGPLGREHLDRIVKIQVARLTPLLADRGLELELTPAAVSLIADHGYDPTFGARPLKRSIQKLLIDPLASAILAGHFVAGDRVRADAADGHIDLSRTEANGEAA
jgi:ATP-dependent Clp protease ATP-binding subunit ClpB